MLSRLWCVFLIVVVLVVHSFYGRSFPFYTQPSLSYFMKQCPFKYNTQEAALTSTFSLVFHEVVSLQVQHSRGCSNVQGRNYEGVTFPSLIFVTIMHPLNYRDRHTGLALRPSDQTCLSFHLTPFIDPGLVNLFVCSTLCHGSRLMYSSSRRPFACKPNLLNVYPLPNLQTVLKNFRAYKMFHSTFISYVFYHAICQVLT